MRRSPRRSARSQRRWPRRLAVAVLVPVVAVAALYGLALLSLDRSSIARAMLWMDSDVGDQYRFPARRIQAGEEVSLLPAGPELDLDSLTPVGFGPIDELLRESGTRAFLVVHEDRLVYERYLGSGGPARRETSFSVAKSFLSTLLGIAVDEGSVASLEDPVTRYVPELAGRDPRFERITLRHLVSMASGLRYREQELPVPWGDDIQTY